MNSQQCLALAAVSVVICAAMGVVAHGDLQAKKRRKLSRYMVEHLDPHDLQDFMEGFEPPEKVPMHARGIAGSSDFPPEFTGEGHKSRRAQGFKPRGVKRRPAAEAAKKAKLYKSERTGPRDNMDGDNSQDGDEEKWPRTLNKLEKFDVLESVKNSELSTEVRECGDQFDACKDDSSTNAFFAIASSALETIAGAFRSGGGGGDPASASASAAMPAEGPRKKRGITAAEASANAELLRFMASTNDETLMSYARRSLVKIDEEE